MSKEEVRVVVVDDVPDSAETLAMVLEMDGYTVRTASSGVQALSLIEEFQPLCVLMDIHMPGVSGHELSQRLRQRYGDDIVLIAVTGWGGAEERVSESFARFDHYLRKPVDRELLRKLLPPVAGPAPGAG
ncbi:response regulator [Roseateles violae]|uniref:Response regulator n=1 Tax=Roseateles violae TaxID=3058042 RepID=A0ABT8DSY1_9BURK|nr:response regulator [Pelomonas sp. PFR6]MDN3921093.1 response regulator [Pelomonas sp. PFR6]